MDDESDIEIEFSFEPVPNALSALGVSREEFDAALASAIETFDESGPIETAPVMIKGVTYELADVSRVIVRGEIQMLREFFTDTPEPRENLDSN